ncbi:MAG: copper chaperone PCu(A)C [Albidovulum sp.]
MKKGFLMRGLRMALGAVALIVAAPALAGDTISITDPYARLLPAAKAGAAFFTIENHQAVDDRLIAVTADIADMVELHTHKMSADGLAQMLPIEGGIAIAAGGSHALARGGDHVMLMGLTSKPGDGEMLTLTLRFEEAGDLVVEVPVDNQR